MDDAKGTDMKLHAQGFGSETVHAAREGKRPGVVAVSLCNGRAMMIGTTFTSAPVTCKRCLKAAAA